MSAIEDTCPGCDMHLTIEEWEVSDDRIECPECGWSQGHKEGFDGP